MSSPEQPKTPNNMPGADNPQMQQPVSTAPPPPDPAKPETPPAQGQQQTAQPESPPTTPPATGEPPKPETNWKEHARTWEQRAKENADKAKKFDEAEAAKRTQEENDRIAIAERDERIRQLEVESRREKIARETGVLPAFLGDGDEDAMRAAATAALEWRGPGNQEPPKPATAAVAASTVTSADKLNHAPNKVQQLTKEQFVALPPAERMQAVRAGQCEDLGVGKPKEQRRMGNSLELGAAVGGQGPVR
jgi:hypothetical protein